MPKFWLDTHGYHIYPIDYSDPEYFHCNIKNDRPTLPLMYHKEDIDKLNEWLKRNEVEKNGVCDLHELNKDT